MHARVTSSGTNQGRGLALNQKSTAVPAWTTSPSVLESQTLREPYLHGVGHVVIGRVVDSGEQVLTELRGRGHSIR